MATSLVNRILFPTDFSEDARRAQEYVASLAAAWGAAVDVLHVVEAPPWLQADPATLAVVQGARQEADRELESVRDQMVRRGVEVTLRHVVGAPEQHIRLAAAERDVDLVVLGIRGRSNLLYGLIGSTTERVVKDAPCPIFAVPGLHEVERRPSSEGVGAPMSRILVALDFSRPSLDAVEYAALFARALGAAVTLLHVIEPVCYDLDYGLGMIKNEAQVREQWNRHLVELQTDLASHGVSAEIDIATGLPSDAVLACALRREIDLIVMGTHGRRAGADLPIGSMAQAILRRAHCPVLAVKAPRFVPGYRRVSGQAVKTEPMKE